MNYISIFVLALAFYFKECLSYSCSTPDEWLGIHPKNTASQNIRPAELWPRGIVKYHLNSSLSEEDMDQIYSAFEEYHTKTCIRFVPKKEGDIDYVSIEKDEKIMCGEAHVCKVGGYQYAKFGENCLKKDTIIHELGHALCLGHEHQRHNRDEYLFYNETCKIYSQNEKQFEYEARGIYDYASQMHYTCNNCGGGWPKQNVTKCGPSVTTGLSVLDADLVNQLYNCQGCYRHRWIPLELLNEADAAKMHNFGNVDRKGTPLIPCRASIDGTLLIGNFNNARRSCTVGYKKKVNSLIEKFEVLTIPGGLRNSNSEYTLVTVHEAKTKTDLNFIFKTAVVAGHLPWADGSGYGNGYVAFGIVKGFTRWCSDNPLRKKRGISFDDDDAEGWAWVSESDSEEVSPGSFPKDEVAVGSVWRFYDEYSAYFALCEKQIQLQSYNVLVCEGRDAWDRPGVNYNGPHEGIRYLETIEGELVPGSTITVVGQIHSDAKAIFFELCEEKTDSSEILHFNVRFDWLSNKNLIVRNSYTVQKGWGHEEREATWETFPFEEGHAFKLVIQCHLDVFQFFIDGVSFVKYKYRLPIKLAKYFRIRGGVDLLHVSIKKSEICQEKYAGSEKPQTMSMSILMSNSSKVNKPKVAASQPRQYLVLSDNSENYTNENNLPVFAQLRDMINANFYFMFSIIILATVFLALVITVIGLVVDKLAKQRKYQDVPVVHVVK